MTTQSARPGQARKSDPRAPARRPDGADPNQKSRSRRPSATRAGAQPGSGPARARALVAGRRSRYHRGGDTVAGQHVPGDRALAVFGIRANWLVLGVLLSALFYAVRRIYIRLAEQAERDFIGIVDEEADR